MRLLRTLLVLVGWARLVWRRWREEWEDIGAANALTVEAVAGYRLNPDVTFRACHAGYRAFGSDKLQHGFACSVVWAHRWW
jgi:hypothetical protein